MIRITKPTQAPEVLRTKGARRRSTHNARYDRGAREFPLDSRIYAHADVKQALIVAQHGKCCFCERVVGEDGDVEHFRPKAAWCQGPGLPVEMPGYYWLAYAWDNLFLACAVCNQRCKKNFFPLAAPDQRARSHHDDVAQERPLLIDPTTQDPETLLSFREEVAYAIDGNPLGTATITTLGLNTQTNLVEKRRSHLALLVQMRYVLDCEPELSGKPEGKQLLADVQAVLSGATADKAEFAAMARAAAAGDFRVSLL